MDEPARFVARIFTSNGAPAYLYRFSYVAQSIRDKVQAHAWCRDSVRIQPPFVDALEFIGVHMAVRFARQSERAALTSLPASSFWIDLAQNGQMPLPPW
jgi:hypothetical protein